MSLIVQSNYLLFSHTYTFEKRDCVFMSLCMCSCKCIFLYLCVTWTWCAHVCLCVYMCVCSFEYVCVHPCTCRDIWMHVRGWYIISQAFGEFKHNLNLSLLLCHFIQFRILWKIIILCGLEFIFTVNSDVLGSFNVLCLWALLLCFSFLECSLMPGDSWQLLFVCIKISRISMG